MAIICIIQIKKKLLALETLSKEKWFCEDLLRSESESSKLSGKNQIINILDFADQIDSIAMTQLCGGSTETVIEST